MSYDKKNVIKLNRKELLQKLYNPPDTGDWLLAVDPTDYRARIVNRHTDGFVSEVDGNEDLFPLLMALERDDGFLEGGDWVVAHTSEIKEHDGLYRSYWIKWDTPEKEIPIEKLQSLRVFLCHASEDKGNVRKLYNRLLSEGFDPWLDEEKLLPGQDWRYEIKNAVRSSHIVIVCLSEKSTRKTGFVQAEVKYALDIADEHPEGSIFIIPLRLHTCNVPNRLSRWQYVDYFNENGHGFLRRALKARIEQGLQ